MFVVIVTSITGRVIRMAPRDTKGKAQKEARMYRAASWVASVEVEEVAA